MIEILAVLGIPLAGGLVLALMGERDEAAIVNIVASFAPFVAAAVLTARVVTDGPMLCWCSTSSSSSTPSTSSWSR
mgnify:CR=1 FL=1